MQLDLTAIQQAVFYMLNKGENHRRSFNDKLIHRVLLLKSWVEGKDTTLLTAGLRWL